MKPSQGPDVLYRVHESFAPDEQSNWYSASPHSLEKQFRPLLKVDRQVPVSDVSLVSDMNFTSIDSQELNPQKTTSHCELDSTDTFYGIARNIVQDLYAQSPFYAGVLTMPGALEWAGK